MTRRQAYRIARKHGYIIRYGNQHYHNGEICRDVNGDPWKGYIVIDSRTNFCVWGSYNEIWDHSFTWEDVVDFVNSL